MNILIASKHTGIGNQIEFIPVIYELIRQGHQVYSDSTIYRDIGMNVEIRLSDRVNRIYIPFGYNWKKFLKVKLTYPFIPVYGYKYRIFKKHIGIGYSKSYRFDEDWNELCQNTLCFGGMPKYPDELKIKKQKNTVVLHNSSQKDRGIDEIALGEFAKKRRHDGYPPIIVGDFPKNKHYIQYYRFTPTFKDLVERLRTAEYYVGPDTGIMHLADCFGVKCLVYFGPTNRYKSGCLNGRNIQSHLECSPCYSWGRVKCERDYECLNISAEKIYGDFIKLSKS